MYMGLFIHLSTLYFICTRLSDYQDKQNFYTPIESWGGAIAKTMHSLINNIETFDLEDFTYKMRKHHNNLESNEGETATHKICELIISFMKKSSTDKS